MKQINVGFTDAMVEDLDRLAVQKSSGVGPRWSRAAVIRSAVQSYLDSELLDPDQAAAHSSHSAPGDARLHDYDPSRGRPW